MNPVFHDFVMTIRIALPCWSGRFVPAGRSGLLPDFFQTPFNSNNLPDFFGIDKAFGRINGKERSGNSKSPPEAGRLLLLSSLTRYLLPWRSHCRKKNGQVAAGVCKRPGCARDQKEKRQGEI